MWVDAVNSNFRKAEVRIALRNRKREGPMKKTYVQIMRELREDNDLTQQEVADYLGTSQTMYARYERGANELPIRHLIRLCEYYQVSSDYFLGLSAKKK